MTTFEKYPPLRIALHWLTVLLLVAVYASMELKGIFPKGSDAREVLKTWHFMLGLSVLLLVLLRLLARWMQPGPPQLPGPAWQAWLAKATHLALYLFMLGMPLAGWLVLSTAGKPVPFFGLELPALMGLNKTLSGQIKDLHETVATIGYFLIGLHALAALFHHYILKDNTLRRMWR
ncbi:cytochrome b561 [Polaromonas sp. OV174]|uniref:cytochrome b n=1 Tax=Polaromonas sp. OV174 TaxID=1855300 RepID=UPI0008EDF4AD|nr:cytochrome b [Polaromonas sp. OV174]SFC57783.1 cytochrome b561 [Polaromonas sp. OV174]